MYCVLFAYQLLDCFHFWTTMNSVAVNIRYNVCVNVVSSLLGMYLGVEIMGCVVLNDEQTFRLKRQ